MITVIDYGMGNLRSVVKAVEKYTDEVRVSSNIDEIISSNALILPGDGAFNMAMENLSEMNLIEPLKKYIKEGGFFLGICLGFQLLFSESEEFENAKGLNIFKGKVVKFQKDNLKVPHMGWNTVKFLSKSKFLTGIPSESYFYFIHSYYPVVKEKDVNLGIANYGKDFTCIVQKENLIATQFHPEKSHTMGLKIIKNFVTEVYKNRE